MGVAEKVSDPDGRYGPSGASHHRGQTPFPLCVHLISCRERWKHAEPANHSLGLAKLTSCRSAEAGWTADAGPSSILQLGVDASFATPRSRFLFGHPASSGSSRGWTSFWSHSPNAPHGCWANSLNRDESTRTYVALVEGTYPQETDRWSDTICKLKDRAEVRLLREPETSAASISPYHVEPNSSAAAELEVGKPAVTQVQRLAVHPNGRTLLELKPETGRMHQLRVQAASRGFPIVGDQQYGSRTQLEGAHTNQIALFASGLQFFDPANGKRIEVTTELPSWCE